MLDLKKKILDGNIPPDVLSAIATLTFPLPPEQMLSLLPVVYLKGDEGIRQAVTRSFPEIPSDVVSDFLLHADDREALLFYFELLQGGAHENAEKYFLDIVRNPASDGEILEKMAALSSSVVLNYLLNNHAVLQAYPSVFDALVQNKALSPAQSKRLQEYLKFGLVGKQGAAPAERKSPVSEKEFPGEDELPAVEEEISGEVLEVYSELTAEESEDVLHSPSAIEIEDDMDLNTFQKLLKMSVSQKIQRALKGNKEERSILIRDSNRIVALAVMQSPKLTEQEAETISAMRNVHRDVLRKLASSRVFLKKYKVVLNLVKNPKVPQDISLTLLHRLTDRDLQLINRDRSLSEFVRRAAQRILRGRKKY
ncbi:MAG: hypothetical protein GXO69_03225 [Acidobacteria bacterium]|nr:hypothetical protein [Acidobacteriota bacterium]